MKILRVFSTNTIGIANTDVANPAVKHHTVYFVNNINCITFAPTVPVLHTIRTAFGSFFLYPYGQ